MTPNHSAVGTGAPQAGTIYVGLINLHHWDEMLLRSMLRMLEGHTRLRWQVGTVPSDCPVQIHGNAPPPGSGLGAEGYAPGTTSTFAPTPIDSHLIVIRYGKSQRTELSPSLAESSSPLVLNAPVRINALRDLLDKVGERVAQPPVNASALAKPHIIHSNPLQGLLMSLRQHQQSTEFQLFCDQHALGLISLQQQRWLPMTDARSLSTAFTGARELTAEPLSPQVTYEWRGAQSLSSFVMQLAELGAGQEILPALQANRPMRLTHWLEIPAQSALRELTPAAAAMTQRSLTLEQLLKIAKVPRANVVAWLNACLVCGFLQIEGAELSSGNPIPPPTKTPAAPQGFVAKLRKRLGLL